MNTFLQLKNRSISKILSILIAFNSYGPYLYADDGGSYGDSSFSSVQDYTDNSTAYEAVQNQAEFRVDLGSSHSNGQGNIWGITAPLLSGKPLTGFLDLNFDGVRGGMMDYLMYSLLFNSNSDSGTSARSFQPAPLIDPVQEAQLRQKRESIQNQVVQLTAALDNGDQKASIKDLTKILGDFLTPKASANDKAVALESLIRLAIKRPTLTSADGPIVSNLWPSYKEQYQGLFRQLSLSNLLLELGFEASKFTRSIEYQVTLSRLIAIVVLHEQAIRVGIPITTQAQDALRGAFYGFSVAIKRLNISNDKKSRLVNRFVTRLAESDSDVVLKLAQVITNEPKLESIQNGIYNLEIVQTERSILNSKALRHLISASAAALALAAWISHGQIALDHLSLTLTTSLQVLAAKGLIPLMSYLGSYLGLKRWTDLVQKQKSKKLGTQSSYFFENLSDKTRETVASKIGTTQAGKGKLSCKSLIAR